jgi:hypothetical protein
VTAKEWRNHTDERIAALFAAQEENARQIAALSQMFAESHRQFNEKWDKTQETINELMAMQIRAEQRMDRLEENIDRVIAKVDSWLENLQSRNGQQ